MKIRLRSRCEATQATRLLGCTHYLEISIRNKSKNMIIVSSGIGQLTSKGLILFLHKRNVIPNLIKRNIVVITSTCQTKCSESRFCSNLTKCLKILKNKNVIESEDKD